ncbi:hypothetical protein, partial [Arenimonas sp. MALMAid1274]|uniref:hypothetical protein n=1 Tax=Arenimonas sp. MALMAid1274 TaxID=3411630 RepID=UPI003BA289D8
MLDLVSVRTELFDDLNIWVSTRQQELFLQLHLLEGCAEVLQIRTTRSLRARGDSQKDHSKYSARSHTPNA